MHKKCERCLQWEKDYGKDVSCNSCPDGIYKNTLNFGLGEKVTLLKGQPGEQRTTRSELNEIARNRCIPVGNGHWKSGRLGDDGKVHEQPLKT